MKIDPPNWSDPSSSPNLPWVSKIINVKKCFETDKTLKHKKGKMFVIIIHHIMFIEKQRRNEQKNYTLLNQWLHWVIFNVSKNWKSNHLPGSMSAWRIVQSGNLPHKLLSHRSTPRRWCHGKRHYAIKGQPPLCWEYWERETVNNVIVTSCHVHAYCDATIQVVPRNSTIVPSTRTSVTPRCLYSSTESSVMVRRSLNKNVR